MFWEVWDHACLKQQGHNCSLTYNVHMVIPGLHSWETWQWAKLYLAYCHHHIILLNIRYNWPITGIKKQYLSQPCHSSGSWLLASQHSGLVFIPGQVMWDLQWTKRKWGRFSLSTFVSLITFHSTNYSTFITQCIIQCYIVSILTVLLNKLKNGNNRKSMFPLCTSSMISHSILHYRWQNPELSSTVWKNAV
jgi:hypothetical protein